MDIDRFWANVDKTDDCWIWTRGTVRNGYGKVWGDGKNHLAHRVAWQALVGDIPKGFTLDHLCQVKRCVNPEHLEPVTFRENSRRYHEKRRNEPTCPNGHTRTKENVYVNTLGERRCKICRVEHQRQYRLRRQLQALI